MLQKLRIASSIAPRIYRQFEVQRLRRICKSKRALCITYDDGPGATATPALLELLREFNARATFFLLGHKIVQQNELIQRMLEEGHEIGNHSMNHLHAWKNSSADVLSDYSEAQQILDHQFPSESRLIRPPYGKITTRNWLNLRKAYQFCWWTHDTCDTVPGKHQPKEIAESLRESGGGVVLLHDMERENERIQFVLDTTEALLVMAQRENLNVICMSELFERSSH